MPRTARAVKYRGPSNREGCYVSVAREGLKRARREQDHDADRDADRDTDHAHSDHDQADPPVHHVDDQDHDRHDHDVSHADADIAVDGAPPVPTLANSDDPTVEQRFSSIQRDLETAVWQIDHHIMVCEACGAERYTTTIAALSVVKVHIERAKETAMVA